LEKRWLEDYAVGERIVSPARTITEADVHAFAALTGDWHPIHTDVGYAAASPFGERIAHGMLVLSVGSALAFRLGPHVYLPKSFIAFYGMERVRFTGPVKLGDKDEARGVLTWDGIVLNQHGKPCCVYTTKLLCGRAPKGAAS